MEWILTRWRAPVTALLCALLSNIPQASGVPLECPVASSTGQPACGASRDVGSSAPDSSRSEHVGNPIDVVSGNKYQSEIDVRLGGSHLSFARHYNSAHAAVNFGLGNGWRHSYAIVLSADGDDIRRIEQSDGRLIEFLRQGELFRARDESDGYVVEPIDSEYIWYLPDGRQLTFFGSFPTSIAFPDGDRLSLMYRGRRLHSVTDSLGRSLYFHYADGRVGLPVYDPAKDSIPSGHLKNVELPDGGQVQFGYSKHQNLVSVDYPSGTKSNSARRYHYQDRLNHALLTERLDGRGRIMARWGYDESGRAVSYSRGSNIRSNGRERGPPTLTLAYSAVAGENEGTTRVLFGNGVERMYEWSLDARGQVETLERLAPDAEASAQTAAGSLEQAQNQRDTAPHTQHYPHDVLTVLTQGELGYPSTIQYTLERDATTHLLESEYDQAGRLVDVKWMSGILEDFNDGQPTTRDEVRQYVVQSKASGSNRDIAIGALARMGQIAGMASEFLQEAGKELVPGSTVTGQELDEAWWSGALQDHDTGSERRYKAVDASETDAPCIDPLKDCTSLLRTRDYAEVAECAYVDADCSTRFVEADLGELNLEIGDLHDGSFHAEVYYDSEKGEYIVTFAGTDFTSAGDWLSNIEQELGFSAFHYEKAIELATKLQEFNQGKNFTFTGHSLGGGLATAAAAVSGADAYVFNPAALDPDSASDLSIEIEVARENTQIYSVRGELLSQVQTGIGFANEAVGHLNVIPRPNFAWVQEHMSDSSMLTYAQRLSLALHGMDAVHQSVNDLIELNRCT